MSGQNETPDGPTDDNNADSASPHPPEKEARGNNQQDPIDASRPKGLSQARMVTRDILQVGKSSVGNDRLIAALMEQEKTQLIELRPEFTRIDAALKSIQSQFDLTRQFELSSPEHAFYRHIAKDVDPYRAMLKQAFDLPSIENELRIASAQLSLTGAIRAYPASIFSLTSLELSRADIPYRLPTSGEIDKILADQLIQKGAVAALFPTFEAALESNIDSISSSWIGADAIRATRSLEEIFSIGSAVRSTYVFDDALTGALRKDFGDWRDPVSFTKDTLRDPEARTNEYIGHGFDPELTDIPDLAFRQTLVVARLNSVPSYLAAFPEVLGAGDEAEAAAIQRSNSCQRLILVLERKLRRFIDLRLSEAHGKYWFKHRLKPDVYAAWQDKQEKAGLVGGEVSLIEFSDFTDYVNIICRDDDWKALFQFYFERKESVRESFQRLYPIRNAAMHSRYATKEDELFAATECTRLIMAIERKRS